MCSLQFISTAKVKAVVWPLCSGSDFDASQWRLPECPTQTLPIFIFYGSWDCWVCFQKSLSSETTDQTGTKCCSAQIGRIHVAALHLSRQSASRFCFSAIHTPTAAELPCKPLACPSWALHLLSRSCQHRQENGWRKRWAACSRLVTSRLLASWWARSNKHEVAKVMMRLFASSGSSPLDPNLLPVTIQQ